MLLILEELDWLPKRNPNALHAPASVSLIIITGRLTDPEMS